jgi:DNA-binding response OmpR family regulator
VNETHKVVIVDDERTITDTLALIFTGSGYDVRKAYSAEQAVDLIAEWRPDLAILDVVLPVMNGIDLAALLKAQYPTCRVLLFSGDTRTTELMAEAAQKGCNFEILAKPVHPTVMLEAAIKMLVADEFGQNKEPAVIGELRAAEVDPPTEG